MNPEYASSNEAAPAAAAAAYKPPGNDYFGVSGGADGGYADIRAPGDINRDSFASIASNDASSAKPRYESLDRRQIAAAGPAANPYEELEFNNSRC